MGIDPEVSPVLKYRLKIRETGEFLFLGTVQALAVQSFKDLV
jgi:hypothetical protein